MEAIRSGLMLGAVTVTQNPVGFGVQVLAAAVKALKGEDEPKVVDTGFSWYDKQNVDDEKIAAVLYG